MMLKVLLERQEGSFYKPYLMVDERGRYYVLWFSRYRSISNGVGEKILREQGSGCIS